MLTRSRAEEIAADFAKQNILVVGDVMLDKYVAGSVERISPEAPVPVVHVREEWALPGGAANVALNIRALGGSVMLVGSVGSDSDGEILKSVLKDRGIRFDGLVEGYRTRTISKTRVLAERQQVVRVDHETVPDSGSALTKGLLNKINDISVDATGAIMEDYGKGVVCQDVVDTILSLSGTHGFPCGFDPKDNHELQVKGVTLATPNYREACMAARLPEIAIDGDPCENRQLAEVGQELIGRWKPEHLMITLGSEGLYLARAGEKPMILPTKAREVFDVCGAGDTVIAVALLCLACGASGQEAADLANHAAGIVVGRVGAATCSVDELLMSI